MWISGTENDCFPLFSFSLPSPKSKSENVVLVCQQPSNKNGLVIAYAICKSVFVSLTNSNKIVSRNIGNLTTHSQHSISCMIFFFKINNFNGTNNNKINRKYLSINKLLYISNQFPLSITKLPQVLVNSIKVVPFVLQHTYILYRKNKLFCLKTIFERLYHVNIC